MALVRGDVVLLRRAGSPDRNGLRAALVWRVDGKTLVYVPIVGTRGPDRVGRHRAEVDLTFEEVPFLPLRYPAVNAHQQHLVALNALPDPEPIGSLSATTMARVMAMILRESTSRDAERRFAYGPRMSFAQEIAA